MALQRACDVCNFFRQNPDGTPAVHRYGLSRQVLDPTRSRPGREGSNSHAAKRMRSLGGIDLCDPCWDRIAKPKTRAELKGVSGPKPLQ